MDGKGRVRHLFSGNSAIVLFRGYRQPRVPVEIDLPVERVPDVNQEETLLLSAGKENVLFPVRLLHAGLQGILQQIA